MVLIEYIGSRQDLQKLTLLHSGNIFLAFEKQKQGKSPLIAICQSNNLSYSPDENSLTLNAKEFAFLLQSRGESHRILLLESKYNIPEIKSLFSELQDSDLKVHFRECNWMPDSIIYVPQKIISGRKEIVEYFKKYRERTTNLIV